MIDWQSIGLDAAKEILLAGARYLVSQGEDPKALLNAELDAADAVAVAELRAIDAAEAKEEGE